MKKLRAGVALFACTVAIAATAGSADANGWRRHHGWWDFHWPNHLPIYLTERLDDSAVDPATDVPPGTGYMWSGSGNSANGFILQQNRWTDTELAIKGKYRQGDDIPPTFIGAALCINRTTALAEAGPEAL